VLQIANDDIGPDAGQLSQHYAVLKELGDCHAALGDFDRARQCYRDSAALEPSSPGPYLGLGVVATQQSRLDRAEEAFVTALEKDPNCAEAYSGLAMIRQQQENYPEALQMYLKCLERDADNLVALLGLFQTSCQMGSFATVIHFLEVYLEKHPGDTSVLFCLATLYAREGRFVEAQDALLDVLTLEPDKAEAANLLAQVQHRLRHVQSLETV
jgi:protein O-GlcNAc transferase